MNEPLVAIGLESPQFVLLQVLLEKLFASWGVHKDEDITEDFFRTTLIDSGLLEALDPSCDHEEPGHGYSREQAFRVIHKKWDLFWNFVITVNRKVLDIDHNETDEEYDPLKCVQKLFHWILQEASAHEQGKAHRF